jgi:hypothetical protein
LSSISSAGSASSLRTETPKGLQASAGGSLVGSRVAFAEPLGVAVLAFPRDAKHRVTRSLGYLRIGVESVALAARPLVANKSMALRTEIKGLDNRPYADPSRTRRADGDAPSIDEIQLLIRVHQVREAVKDERRFSVCPGGICEGEQQRYHGTDD